MKMEAVFKRTLVAAAAVLMASPVFAQATATSSTTTTHHKNSAGSDSNYDNSDAQDAQSTTTTSSSVSAPAAAPAQTVVVEPAPAAPTAVIIAEQPKTEESSVRLIPALGSSSFANDSDVHTDNFRGMTAALFADFGKYDASFETGIETFASSVRTSRGTSTVSVNSWGIPLLAKWNMSGKPQETVYLKAGAMPFVTNGADSNSLDFMGVAGVGGNIPLGRNSSIMLDATYNRLFNNDGDLTNLQGIALLGGLSINL
jgi:hypothetical protein